MKTVEEIAKQAAVDYLKFKLGDRKGFNVYDIDAQQATIQAAQEGVTK